MRILHTSTGHAHHVGSFSVRSLYPNHGYPSPDPFLLFDHFGPFSPQPGDAGVGAHPHFGAEIGTYVLQGTVAHRDSKGNHGLVGPGGLQWMTVGAGLIHAEGLANRDPSEQVEGIQFWINMPASEKWTTPRYKAFAPAELPTVQFQGGSLRVIAGEWEGAHSPLQSVTPFRFLHLTLEAGANLNIPAVADASHNLYLKQGQLTANGAALNPATMYHLQVEEGQLQLTAGAQGAEVILLSAKPLKEPVYFHGPFVASSPAQIQEVFEAYHSGRMGQLDGLPG